MSGRFLLVNLNNTNTTFALADHDRILARKVVATANLDGVPFRQDGLSGAVLSSVVPSAAKSLRRQLTDHFFTGLAASLSVVVVCTLIAIFAYLVLKGVGSLNWSFLTQTPKPVGEPGGGMANAANASSFVLRPGCMACTGSSRRRRSRRPCRRRRR